MKNNDTNIKELLSRAVGAFVDPEGLFEKKLKENPEKVIIKLGFDPTKPDIHLGHAVVLRKLRAFQDLGCKVVFLVGDYTAQIGDPTGKSAVRPDLEQMEVDKNAATYIEQVGKILRTDPGVFSWIRNSDWYYGPTDIVPDPRVTSINIETKKEDGFAEKITIPTNSFLGKAIFYEETRMQKTHLKLPNVANVTLKGLLWTMKHITHAQLIERDMFQDRLQNNQELYMHEMLYPILQGIDSLMIHHIYGGCDLEIGGTDQHFNMLMGRNVMRANNVPPQAVLSFKLLEGTDGKEKMSKSLDNYIAINDTPEDMYGKVMSIPDSSIANYFELCTYTPLADVEDIKKEIEKSKVNPRDLKMRLGREIVAVYHGDKKAHEAEAVFVNVFQKKELPENIESITVTSGASLVDVALENNIVESKTEIRRLIEDGAVKEIDADGGEQKITDTGYKIEKEITLKIGKRRFVKFSPK